VVANQRDRILDAVAEEVASNGYMAVTVGEVIARARVSRKTFYDLFRDKADCFLAAFDAAIETLLGQVRAVFAAMPEATPARARAVLAAVLEVLAAEPAFARMCMVEAPAAGPAGRERYMSVLERFVPLVEELEKYRAAPGQDSQVGLQAIIPKALIGGIAAVISERISAGETERLPELLPELTHFLLAPFLGEHEAGKYSAEAREQIADRARERARAERASTGKPNAARRTAPPGDHTPGDAQTPRESAQPKPAARARRGRRSGADRRSMLTRRAIADAAIRIADSDGLRAVSMRRIAAELEVAPMSLYTRIADKDDLLALITDQFVASMLVTEPLPADWREAVTEIAWRSRAAFVAHPWALELFAQHARPGPNAIQYAKQQAHAVAGLGLEPADVWTLLANVDDYLIGNALRVATTGLAQDLRDALSPSDLAELPDLRPLETLDRERPSGESFEIGLQALLDGAERRFVRRSARRTAGTRKAAGAASGDASRPPRSARPPSHASRKSQRG
jgi:AcrR family transcriptional regulator